MNHFLVRIAARLVVLAVVIGFVTYLLPGLQVVGNFLWVLWIAVVFSAVNLVVGTIVRLLTLPLTIATLGLFLIVINAAMLYLTAALTGHLRIDHVWSALAGALLISVFGWLAELLLPIGRRHRRGRR